MKTEISDIIKSNNELNKKISILETDINSELKKNTLNQTVRKKMVEMKTEIMKTNKKIII